MNSNLKRNNNKMKKNRQRRRRDNFTNVAARRFGWIQPRTITTLRYSDTFPLTAATSTYATQVFRMNSLFDPDLTNAGHQPYGYDQLTAIYNRYRVFNFRWRVMCSCETLEMTFLCVPVNGQLTITGGVQFLTAMEYPRSITKIQNSGGPQVVFTGQVDLNVINGTTRQQYNADDRFQALVSTNPTEVMSFQIGYANETASSITFVIAVQLEYTAEIFDILTETES